MTRRGGNMEHGDRKFTLNITAVLVGYVMTVLDDFLFKSLVDWRRCMPQTTLSCAELRSKGAESRIVVRHPAWKDHKDSHVRITCTNGLKQLKEILVEVHLPHVLVGDKSRGLCFAATIKKGTVTGVLSEDEMLEKLRSNTGKVQQTFSSVA